MKSKMVLNFKLFKKHFGYACGVLFGVASSMLLFIDKSEIFIDSLWKELFVLGALIFLSAGYAAVRVLFYLKIVEIKGKLILRYGDLWSIAFSKKKKIVVVSVNTAFDTIVDEHPSEIKNPLVAAGTVHGQWIGKMREHNVPVRVIDEKIEENLKLQGIAPSRVLSRDDKKRGKLECYPKGTIAVCEYKNTIFYLLALSEFDENNNARNSREELIGTIIKLIDYYDKNGNGMDIYVPLMGTGLSRTEITEEDSLRILTSMFKLYRDKVCGCASIIVYSKNRDKVSLAL